MSVISYNDIVLPHAFHTKFLQKPMLDPSNTDWYCTMFDIQVEAIITPDYLAIIAPDLARAHASAANLMNSIRDQLLKPRRQLSIKVNGVELIPRVAEKDVPGTVDAQNGPQPQSCEITQLTSATFLITYSIITYVWEKRVTADGTETLEIGHNVLFNRWSETQDIDNCDYTTFTREGTFIIRSDNSPDGVIADDMRSAMAVLALRANFNRVSSSYVVDPNGLGIRYRIVDREVFQNPPSITSTITLPPPFPPIAITTGAHEADGEYTETTAKGGGMRIGFVRIRLKGSRTTDSGRLIALAFAVAAAKLRTRGPAMTPPGGGIPPTIFSF